MILMTAEVIVLIKNNYRKILRKLLMNNDMYSKTMESTVIIVLQLIVLAIPSFSQKY
jgi:hypothetical protein